MNGLASAGFGIEAIRGLGPEGTAGFGARNGLGLTGSLFKGLESAGFIEPEATAGFDAQPSPDFTAAAGGSITGCGSTGFELTA